MGRMSQLHADSADARAGAVEMRLLEVEQAVRDFHHGMDRLPFASTAALAAMTAIETSLGMPYVPGAEKARRERAEADRQAARARADAEWAAGDGREAGF